MEPDKMKIIVERHADGYIAYPLGIEGAVVGQGDTYEQALADAESAVRFHIDTFGRDVIDSQNPVLEAFVTDSEIQV